MNCNPGSRVRIDDAAVAALLNTTLRSRPRDGATHWSVRTLAGETRISKSSVQRYLSLFGVQPRRTTGFELSTNPFFVEKVRDVVGLHVKFPGPRPRLVRRLEKPMPSPGTDTSAAADGFQPCRRSDSRPRANRTITRFAALEVLTGTVTAKCKPRQRHQEFLAFLRRLDRAVPADLDIHFIIRWNVSLT